MLPLTALIELPAGNGAHGSPLPAADGDDMQGDPGDFAVLLAGLDPAVLRLLATAADTVGGGGPDGRLLPPGGNPLPLPVDARALLAGQAHDMPDARAVERLAAAARTLQRGGADGGALRTLQQRDASSAELLLPSAGGGRTSASTSAAAPAAPQPALPLNQPQFDRMLGQRLVMLVQHGTQDARIRVHPEHLGPIDVRMRMDGDALQLTLASPHAAVRETLEQALPRLRDALADAGVDLAQADVGEGRQQGAGNSGDGRPAADADGPVGGGDDDADAHGSRGVVATAVGLVDTFA